MTGVESKREEGREEECATLAVKSPGEENGVSDVGNSSGEGLETLSAMERLLSYDAWMERGEHLDVAAQRCLFAALFGAVTGGLLGFNKGMELLKDKAPIVVPTNPITKKPSHIDVLAARKQMYTLVSRELGKRAVLMGSKLGLLAVVYCTAELALGQLRQSSVDDPINITAAAAATGALMGVAQAGGVGMRTGAMVGAATGAVFAAVTFVGNYATSGMKESVEKELEERRLAKEAEIGVLLEPEFNSSPLRGSVDVLKKEEPRDESSTSS